MVHIICMPEYQVDNFLLCPQMTFSFLKKLARTVTKKLRNSKGMVLFHSASVGNESNFYDSLQPVNHSVS